MTIHRNVYDVLYLDPDGNEVEARVRVTMGDQIDAEEYGPQLGLVDPIKQSRAIGALWLWFAMRREGVIDDAMTWPEFRKVILDNSKVGPEPVPPTVAAHPSVEPPNSPNGSRGSTTEGGSTHSATTNV